MKICEVKDAKTRKLDYAFSSETQKALTIRSFEHLSANEELRVSIEPAIQFIELTVQTQEELQGAFEIVHQLPEDSVVVFKSDGEFLKSQIEEGAPNENLTVANWLLRECCKNHLWHSAQSLIPFVCARQAMADIALFGEFSDSSDLAAAFGLTFRLLQSLISPHPRLELVPERDASDVSEVTLQALAKIAVTH